MCAQTIFWVSQFEGSYGGQPGEGHMAGGEGAIGAFVRLIKSAPDDVAEPIARQFVVVSVCQHNRGGMIDRVQLVKRQYKPCSEVVSQ